MNRLHTNDTVLWTLITYGISAIESAISTVILSSGLRQDACIRVAYIAATHAEQGRVGS